MTARRLLARVGALSDTGLQREHNEDRYLVQELGGAPADGPLPDAIDLSLSTLLLAVCDGMGGAVAGEVASGLAVGALAERARDGAALGRGHHLDPGAMEDWLLGGVREANLRTLRRGQEEEELEGMGSTLTCVLLGGETLLLAHVGDSRAYHLRGERLRRISLDHSFVGRLVAMGRISEAEARRHEQRNLLLEAVGGAPELEIDRLRVTVREGDRLLLCSDGLSNLVGEEEIREILGGARQTAEQCAVLVEMANARGGDDNITVVVAHLS